MRARYPTTLLALFALLSCDSATGPAAPGVPEAIEAVGGDLQQGTVGDTLAAPLVVRVLDGAGNPVPRQLVNFRVTAGGGSLAAGAVLTDAEGRASDRWALGTAARDTQRAEARVLDAATGTVLASTSFRAVGTADVPAALAPLGDTARSGAAGAPLTDSLAVRVVDRFGNPVSGAAVVWSVPAGGGSVSPAGTASGADGVARASWSLGTRLDTVHVAEAAAALTLRASFTATPSLPLGTTLDVVSGAGQTGTVGSPLPVPLRVAARLPDGRPLTGAAIAWSPGDGDGALTPPISRTDAAGEAAAEWILGTTAGTQTATASAAGQPGAPVQATIEALVLPAAPAAIARIGDSHRTGTVGQRLADSLEVRVTDRYGNPVPGTGVAWMVRAGGGSVAPQATTTDAEGIARAAWTLGTRADTTHVVEAVAAMSLTTTFTATPAVEGALRLVELSGRGQSGMVGSTLPEPLRVAVETTDGRRVQGVTVTWAAGSGSGSVAPATSVTDAAGEAAAQWTLGTAAGPQTATASAAGMGPVAFSAVATSPTFDIRVTSPVSGATLTGDSLRVVSTASSSTGGIVRMTARVEDRRVELATGTGWVPLAGLAEAEYALIVTAYSSSGDSASLQVPFKYNAPPRLQVSTSAHNTVIRSGAVRVDATCTDATPCTIGVYFTPSEPLTPPSGTLMVQETGAVNADISIPVATFDGTRFWLSVVARDERGGFSWMKVPLYAESTPRWTEVASGGIQALDVDASRLLYVDSVAGEPARVMVRPLAGGTATEVLVLPVGAEIRTARLFPGGAVFSTGDAVFEWRGGTTTLLSNTPYLGYTLAVAGDWAVWHVGNSLYRRDLSAGTTALLTAQATNNGADVAENGDVAYLGSAGDVVWVRGGVPEVVRPGPGNRFGVTDGTQVVYATEVVYPTGGDIRLYRGGADTRLSTHTYSAAAHRDFEANGGWAAYRALDAGGVLHVWTVAPDGTVRQASFGSGGAIAALGPQGALVFSGPGVLARRFLSLPPYGSAVDVGGAIGAVRYQNGAFHVFVGRSVFRITP